MAGYQYLNTLLEPWIKKLKWVYTSRELCLCVSVYCIALTQKGDSNPVAVHVFESKNDWDCCFARMNVSGPSYESEAAAMQWDATLETRKRKSTALLESFSRADEKGKAIMIELSEHCVNCGKIGCICFD